jgi:fatty-acyl-CoA synthase
MLGVGDAPVSNELLALWSRKGAPLSQWYGLAEAFSVALVPPHRAREQLDAAGFPMMHADVRIGDEFGRQFTRGEIGEIQVRGPGVTPGYWRNEDATRAAFVGGWLRTGDVGRIDASGALHVINRTHDTFVSGGEIVYPALVERVIAEVPGIERVALIGVADPRWGKVGLALVTVRPGAVVSEADVIDQCRERVGRFQTPRYARIVDKLPLTLQGEVWKHELRAQYADFRA